MPCRAMWFTENLISIESQRSEERGDRRALVSCRVLRCMEYPLVHSHYLRQDADYVHPNAALAALHCNHVADAFAEDRRWRIRWRDLRGPGTQKRPGGRRRGREDLQNREDERRWPPPDWTAHSPISQQRPQGS